MTSWLPILRSLLPMMVGALSAFVVGICVSPLWLVEDRAEIVAAKAQLESDLAAIPADAMTGRSTLDYALAGYEDRGFFTRPTSVPPVSPTGLARAVIRNIGGRREGASTLPMQLAKLYVRGDSPASIPGKVEEILFATWMMRQASRDQVLFLYMNRSSSRLLGIAPDSVDGADTLALKLFGRRVHQLTREEQLLLAATPWGLGRMRKHRLSAPRIASAHAWLIEEGHWDASQPSYLDDLQSLTPAELYAFNPSWRETVASAKANSTDFDLIEAIAAFRKGLSDEIRTRFPSARARMAFAVVDADGVLARSGAESMAMHLNYGSIAKLELLRTVTDILGPESASTVEIHPRSCVRWFWTNTRSRSRGRWCPTDVSSPDGPKALDETVARSINTLTARHLVAAPLRIWLADPDTFAAISTEVSDDERTQWDSDADRAITANLLSELGVNLPPDDVPKALSYTGLQVAWLRYLNANRERDGLPTAGLPEDVTAVIGNSSRATVEQVATYAHNVLFEDEACALSDTGALLALQRENGTLRYLANRRPELIFAGKTGSSPHDDSAVAVVAVCLDGRSAVLAGALRAVDGKLPSGLHGSTILRGFDRYLEELEDLDRSATAAVLPEWATQPEPVENITFAAWQEEL